MIITAEKRSSCEYCDIWINKGEDINWDCNEKSASHVKCFRKQEAKERLEPISNYIRTTGESPVGMNKAEGEKLIDETTKDGYGYWCVIGIKWIWYVQNNNNESLGWSRSNVEGRGYGGIGWRIQYNEDLAQKIRDIADMFNKANDMPEHSGNPISDDPF